MSHCLGQLPEFEPCFDFVAKKKESSISRSTKLIIFQYCILGLISWIVVDEKNVKLAILSVAWEVGNGIESRFTVKLSDDEPSFEDMWQKTKDNKMASTNQLDNTVYVGGISKLRFVAAANMTMNEGDTLHYRLRLSLVPSNIDVWGWVKYYR